MFMRYSPFRHFTRDPPLRASPVLVRLACLIHAANVRSEPGSNPSIFFPSPPLRELLFKIEEICILTIAIRLILMVRIAVGQAHKSAHPKSWDAVRFIAEPPNRRRKPAAHAFPRSRTPAQFSKSRMVQKIRRALTATLRSSSPCKKVL